MNSKTIEIPDGYILMKTTDDNGEIIYRVKKDDYTKIKTLDDVIRILGENDKLVKTHSLLVETQGVAYSVIARLRVEMIVNFFTAAILTEASVSDSAIRSRTSWLSAPNSAIASSRLSGLEFCHFGLKASNKLIEISNRMASPSRVCIL